MTDPAVDFVGAFPPNTGLRIGRVETLDANGLKVSVVGIPINAGFLNEGDLEVDGPVAIMRGDASWLALGGVNTEPVSSAVQLLNTNLAAGAASASAVYINLPVSPLTFQKYSSTSRLRIDMHVTSFTSVTTSGVDFGVLVNGIDTTVCFLHPTISAGVHLQCSGVQLIAGLDSGAWTVQPRFRRSGGAGTINVNTDDNLSIAVTEVRA